MYNGGTPVSTMGRETGIGTGAADGCGRNAALLACTAPTTVGVDIASPLLRSVPAVVGTTCGRPAGSRIPDFRDENTPG